ncbi:MAG: hypothetical protein ASARMPRED_005364 [Alectoria sarmentosa]|nr:MAG: hypothetical protein ASARMPRED_005364 [Alectoria sarmentosa]
MTLSDTSWDCKVCHDIWRRFADHNAIHEINLGSFEDAVSSECPRHTPLVERFRNYCHNGNATIRDSNDVGIRAGENMGCVQLTQSLSKGGRFWNLLLVKQDSVPDHVGTGRILDPDWVDLDIVKQWKNQCLASHGPKCENPMKIWSTRPAWLIDNENKSVVSGQCRGAFVALSYGGGEHSGFMLNTDTMAKLRKPNALDSPEISMHLTPILRHAMYLTSAIGERYLWVDALCIVYGDDAATAEQLNLRGAICANAIVTIIAADGDSQDGLLGLRDISAPRKLKQHILPFGEEEIVVQNTNLFYSTQGTPYYDRGWAYQEDKMSQRKILFNQKEVHWECQCHVWHEEMIFGAEVKGYIDPRLSVILAGFPDMGSLNHLITTYNKRELSFEEDALPAISGLLSVVSRSFTGGFIYGLPEMLFDRGLGWRPHWNHTNLRRRVQSDRPSTSRLSHLSLPSWSWIGWQGMVTGGHGEAVRINDRQSFIEETIPITEWYTSSSPSGSPLRRVRSTWFENRDAFKDFTKPLPTGWTRHEVLAGDSSSRLYPDGCNGYVFKHCNMPDEDCDSWYFPFPVADIQESTPPFTPDQTSYIFCETRRARLWLHQAGNKNILEICNKAGDSIGSLHLHSQEQLERFPKTVANDVPRMQIELVAIYRSRKYAKTFDEEQKRYTYPHKVSESYEVLWVEWVDGVAYRLASGHVRKADWEESDLEDVSLILH